MTKDFKNLEIWKNAHAFTLDVYQITNSFPVSEQYGLTHQLRKATASISANIAEGCGRGSDKDFLRFLYNAYGSVKECENFILISKDLGYLNETDFKRIIDEVDSLSRMLNRFIGIIRSDSEAQSSRLRAQSSE